MKENYVSTSSSQANQTKNLIGCAFCVALGVTVPMVFHLFGLGMAFSPMHLPILLCGLAFGPLYGFLCGLITPLISSLITGMPPLYPTCITMTFELTIYGFLSGLLYRKFGLNLYLSLLISMISGRIVGGIISAILFGVSGQGYSLTTFISAYFIDTIPGIIIQIIVVPLLVLALIKAKVINKPLKKETNI